MKQRTPFTIMTMLLILAIGLAACAPASTPAPVATEPPPEPTATQAPAAPAVKEIILATTTSTQDSGLLDVLIPAFEKQSGYTVKTVAVGTGQALKMGEEGNAEEREVPVVHESAGVPGN